MKQWRGTTAGTGRAIFRAVHIPRCHCDARELRWRAYSAAHVVSVSVANNYRYDSSVHAKHEYDITASISQCMDY